MASKANISKKDERILHTKSGNRCAMCKIVLVEPNNINASCIGENAHIFGEKPDAARYDKKQSEDFINSEKNLIFLCCNCHKKIDTDITAYPTHYLFETKSKHENWVSEKLKEEILSFSFAEIEVLVNHLLECRGNKLTTISYDVLKIGDKITKNSLEDVQQYITMGLTSSKTILEFINGYPTTSFSKKLTGIMSDEYKRLKAEGIDSLNIFYDLWEFASGSKEDFKYKAAGLGILTYFFEECEVFEK